MISGQAGILAAIVIYLLAMVYVGFYFSKKGSGDSADDFYLGGRKLGPFVTAMSAEASDMSSWLLMGLPGVAYLTGIADAGWTAIGLGLGGRGQAPCGGCCVDGIGQPLFEPYIIAILKLQLQIVGAVRLLVGVGGRQEIGAHTAGDVRALEKYLRRDAARLIRAAHPTTCFHGGRASPTSSAGSGSFSTIPAGKV